MFQLLKKAVPTLNFSPEEFLLDFESATIKAISQEFPECQVVLCFFHMSQSVNRNIISKGLAAEYRESEDI